KIVPGIDVLGPDVANEAGGVGGIGAPEDLTGLDQRESGVLIRVGRRSAGGAAGAAASRLAPGHEPGGAAPRPLMALPIAVEIVEGGLVVHVDGDEHAVGDPLGDGVVVVLGANDRTGSAMGERRLPFVVGGD